MLDVLDAEELGLKSLRELQEKTRKPTVVVAERQSQELYQILTEQTHVSKLSVSLLSSP